jgi:hypothetical protein
MCLPNNRLAGSQRAPGSSGRHGCIGLEPEVLEVVGGGEVAAFTAEEDAGGCL